MQVNLFTTTYNNESLIKDFVEFYRERVPNIIINVYDINSTDKTVEIAKELKCNVRDYNHFYTCKNIWKNECWKYIPTDCVVICNINEFIDLQPNIFQNCSLVMCKGYDITNIKTLTTDKRNTDFDKICIFDPHVIKNINFDGASCNPQGFIRMGEKQPILYHLTKLK